MICTWVCWKHVGIWYLHITLTRSQRKFSSQPLIFGSELGTAGQRSSVPVYGCELGKVGRRSSALSEQLDWPLKIAWKGEEKCLGRWQLMQVFWFELAPLALEVFGMVCYGGKSPTPGVYNILRECSGYTQLRLFGVCVDVLMPAFTALDKTHSWFMMRVKRIVFCWVGLFRFPGALHHFLAW